MFSPTPMLEDQSSYSQADFQGAKKTTLRPLTCMQAQRAVKPHPDGEFELDGQILNSVSMATGVVRAWLTRRQVTMVAVVRNVSDGASAWTYNLEDGTGSIDARLWKNKGDENVEEAPGVASVPTFARWNSS